MTTTVNKSIEQQTLDAVISLNKSVQLLNQNITRLNKIGEKCIDEVKRMNLEIENEKLDKERKRFKKSINDSDSSDGVLQMRDGYMFPKYCIIS